MISLGFHVKSNPHSMFCLNISPHPTNILLLRPELGSSSSDLICRRADSMFRLHTNYTEPVCIEKRIKNHRRAKGVYVLTGLQHRIKKRCIKKLILNRLIDMTACQPSACSHDIIKPGSVIQFVYATTFGLEQLFEEEKKLFSLSPSSTNSHHLYSFSPFCYHV